MLHMVFLGFSLIPLLFHSKPHVTWEFDRKFYMGRALHILAADDQIKHTRMKRSAKAKTKHPNTNFILFSLNMGRYSTSRLNEFKSSTRLTEVRTGIYAWPRSRQWFYTLRKIWHILLAIGKTHLCSTFQAPAVSMCKHFSAERFAEHQLPGCYKNIHEKEETKADLLILFYIFLQAFLWHPSSAEVQHQVAWASPPMLWLSSQWQSAKTGPGDLRTGPLGNSTYSNWVPSTKSDKEPNPSKCPRREYSVAYSLSLCSRKQSLWAMKKLTHKFLIWTSKSYQRRPS